MSEAEDAFEWRLAKEVNYPAVRLIWRGHRVGFVMRMDSEYFVERLLCKDNRPLFGGGDYQLVHPLRYRPGENLLNKGDVNDTNPSLNLRAAMRRVKAYAVMALLNGEYGDLILDKQPRRDTWSVI